MKKQTILLFLFFASLSVFGQDFNGNYKNGSDSLSFSNGKVKFCISGFGGLSTRMVGEGGYEYFDNYLLVNTSDYSGEKTVFEPLNGSKKDSIVVKVVDIHNYSLPGVLTEFLSESNKVIRANITDGNGRTELSKDQKIRKIRVSNLGHNDIVFDIIPEKDFLVRLAKNNVIENKTVVFNVKEKDEEALSIILLSDNFEPGKDRMKSLEKLEKKAQKSNVLAKRLKKEYVPIYGR